MILGKTLDFSSFPRFGLGTPLSAHVCYCRVVDLALKYLNLSRVS